MNTKTSQRKRGRPAGRDRVPLSVEERRARNALYERERRTEQAQAITELVEASGLDPRMSFENLLRHVCCYFKEESRRPTEESVESLRQINYDLLQKIEQTEANLAAPTPPQSPTDEEDTCMRTRPYIYIRKVKKESNRSSSDETIKTEADIKDNPTQTTEQPEIKTEVDAPNMLYTIHERKQKKLTQITEPTANATVKIKTEVDMETERDHERQFNATESRPHKKRKIDHNTAVAVRVKVNPADTDVKTTKSRKKRKRDHNTEVAVLFKENPADADAIINTTKCGLTKADKELELQETEQCPQEIPLQADPLILGLFTEAEAKHDIVQYYINLLIEEGYTGGASSGSSEPRIQQTNEDHAVR